MIHIIAAIDKNRGLGYQNKLLFWIPDDLKNFKRLTTGNTVLMGRKTFESLPKGALPNRRNIVVSTQKDYKAPGAEVYHSLQEAFDACTAEEEIFVMGGAAIYRQAIGFAHQIHLTEIDAEAEHADVFFPEMNPSEWKEEERQEFAPDEKQPHHYAFVKYIRR